MLRARLLGALEIELNGTVIDSPATQRPWAVFAYLALADRPATRAELANTFWPDVLDQSSRASLRSALWALRRRIGDELLVDGERVQLSDHAWVDVREFERLEPAEALALSRGELLEELDDEWALQARARHRERVIELLEEQAEAAEPSEAIRLTRLQVERDPFDERAHRRLIARQAAVGDRAGAIRTYRAFAEHLRRELGVAPSASTRGLVEGLTGEVPPPAGPVLAPGLLPLVGRQAELSELQRAWHAATKGAGVVALVRGEAGIGKTRLAVEVRLRAAASGARTATCGALDLGGTAPFSLWAELIRELLPTLPAPPADAAWPDDLAVLVAELPSHFGRSGVPAITVAPDLQRTRLFEAVVALLGWAARDKPLLLVLEDAHDADTPSLELAGYAARRLAALPVMFLITRRELPDSPDLDRLEHALRSRGVLASELRLGPLPPVAVGVLARKAAALSEADVARVVARAEGNPLLAVESAKVVHEQVAPSIRGSVRATVSPLSGDVRRLVEIAAVAARRLEPAELDELSLDDAAADALQTGLLAIDGGRLGFRHALLREAAYEEIAEPRRRMLHRSWADATRRPDEAARHLRLAGADQEAVPHLIRAAADARAVAALAEAVAYLEEALAIEPDRADEWLELGELEAWRGRREPSEAAFQRALQLLASGDSVAHARGWLRRGRAYHGPICDPRTVLESSRTALELLERLDAQTDTERSEAVAAAAWAQAAAGSVEEAERLLVELNDLAPATDDLRTYDAGHARAHALMRRGRFTDAYAPFVAAAQAIARAGRPDLTYGCWANAAGAATAAGEPERALEFLDRGMEAVAGCGLQSLEIQMLGARSFVLRGMGRLAQARGAASAEQALAEQLGQPELEAMADHDRGLVALEEGECGAAAALLSG
ncbi:MAG: AAA family ATPase, partial [Solirubrobacteraceae bacterium]